MIAEIILMFVGLIVVIASLRYADRIVAFHEEVNDEARRRSEQDTIE